MRVTRYVESATSGWPRYYGKKCSEWSRALKRKPQAKKDGMGHSPPCRIEMTALKARDSQVPGATESDDITADLSILRTDSNTILECSASVQGEKHIRYDWRPRTEDISDRKALSLKSRSAVARKSRLRESQSIHVDSYKDEDAALADKDGHAETMDADEDTSKIILLFEDQK